MSGCRISKVKMDKGTALMLAWREYHNYEGWLPRKEWRDKMIAGIVPFKTINGVPVEIVEGDV